MNVVAKIGFQNVGPAKDEAIIDFVLDNKLAAVGLTEISDRDRLIAGLRKRGLGVIRPQDHVGQPATALVYDPKQMLLVHPFSVPLYQGGYIGEGTGPDDGKPKFFQGGRFIYLPARQRMKIGVDHAYAGQKQPTGPKDKGNLRQQISREMIEKSRREFDNYTGIGVIVGDFNAEPSTPTLAPLRNHNWLCDHEVLRELPTHGDAWTPDHLWLRKDPRCHIADHRVVKTGSDHRGLVVALNVQVRARKHR